MYVYIYIYLCVCYFFQKQSLDTVNLVGTRYCRLGHWRAQHSSYEHCFSLAEIMFWSQGTARRAVPWQYMAVIKIIGKRWEKIINPETTPCFVRYYFNIPHVFLMLGLCSWRRKQLYVFLKLCVVFHWVKHFLPGHKGTWHRQILFQISNWEAEWYLKLEPVSLQLRG